jgi:hypothetical protein
VCIVGFLYGQDEQQPLAISEEIQKQSEQVNSIGEPIKKVQETPVEKPTPSVTAQVEAIPQEPTPEKPTKEATPQTKPANQEVPTQEPIVETQEPPIEKPTSEQASQETPKTSGPDTVELSEEKIGFRGNWVKKREWLLRAKEQNNKIQALIAEIRKYRPGFMEKFTIIQNELDSFYREIGNRIGKLQSSFQSFLGQEEKTDSDREPTLDEFDDIASFKKDLEMIPKESDPINKLDAALSKRIEKLDEQLNNASSEGIRAQQLYDEMWDMIDDTKAQSHFYDMKGITKIIKSIQEYLQGTYAQDFDATIETTQKQIEEYKEKLLDLEGTFKAIQKSEEEKQRARRRPKPKQSEPWYSSIIKPFTDAYGMISSTVYSGIKMVGSWFSKTPERKTPPKPTTEKIEIPQQVTIPQVESQATQ